MIGFTCPRDGGNYRFDHCIYKCEDTCEPLPLLLALMSEKKVVPGRYSVTELLNPPQQTFLGRHHPYYSEPESMIAMTFGSAWHGVLEAGKEKLRELKMVDRFAIEESFYEKIETPFGTGTLSGRPDLYDRQTKILWDWKSVKGYFLKKIRSQGWSGTTYHHQLNTYRVYHFLEAQHMKLKILVKDFSEKMKAIDGIRQVETLDVPLINDKLVRQNIEAKMGLQFQYEVNPELVRPCSGVDTWGGKKCTDYCNVYLSCPQYLAKNKGGVN